MVTRIVVRSLRMWMIALLALLPLHPASAKGEPPIQPRGQPQADAPIGVAAIFTVNSTADAVDTNIGNGVCATAGSVCTLRAAIQEANFTAAADTINLPGGTYTLSLTGANEDFADTGDLDILDDLTIVGAIPFPVIDGGGADRVFDIYNPADVTLQLVSIQNGRAASGGLYGNLGGGLITDAGITVTLNNVLVYSNTATDGGGIHNFNTSSRLVINNTSIRSNTSSNNGAGVFNAGRLTLGNSALAFNNSSGSGGGIQNPVGATLTMTTSYLEFNQAGNGGGLNNTGTAVITNSEISLNTAVGNGGAVGNLGGTLTITNTTLSFNTANLTGGAISTNGSAVLANVTIYSNTAPVGQGGGIFTGGTTQLRNTLLADNTGGNCNAAPLSFGNNLDSANTCGLGGSGDLINTNPLLDPVLRPNGGGSAYTHALFPGSPAIDRGNNSACPAGDQRGVARVDGNLDGSVVCDIGAFEFELLKVYLPLILKSP
ncbi:MAG: choice-of-anchor Q domain-containing protein [Anaerolineales bacterium]